ncbi:hypothetical protein [Bradyrhizobium cenepequi]
MNSSLQKLVDAGRITVDADGVVRLTAAAWRSMVNAPTLHFVGFKDDRVHNARRVFGEPDFWHRFWDHRAAAEIAHGDVVVFAEGDEAMPPRPYAFDDSAMQ